VSFFRPEAVAWLRRFAEPAIALGVLLWLWYLGGARLWRGEALGLLYAGLALVAGAWAVTSAFRAILWVRRRQGPGIVAVREGGIAYFGPESGGFAALDALVSVEMSDGAWVLTGEDGTRLEVPEGAEGVDAMLDALGTLRGFDAAAGMKARAMGRPVTAWRAGPDRRRLGGDR